MEDILVEHDALLEKDKETVQNGSESHLINVSYYEFWQITWVAWKKGELESVSSAYHEAADMNFDDFLKTSLDAKNPETRNFFTAHPPLHGEFLICFSGKNPNLVMTNQRLWMYDLTSKEMVNFRLSDISEFKSKRSRNSFQVRVLLKDNTERIFEKVTVVPSDQAIELTFKHYNSAQNWNILTGQTSSQIEGHPLQTIQSTESATVIEDKEIDILYGMKKRMDWFIRVDEGEAAANYYTKEDLKTKLKSKVINGIYEKITKIEVHAKNKEGKWQKTETILFAFAKEYFPLRILYQPVWAHAMAGLKWGMITGICLKLLDTAILLAATDPALAFMFVGACVVCVIPRIGWVGIVAISIIMAKFSSANFFMIALAAGLTGAILGSLPGMSIGGIIGALRRSSIQLARDATPEPPSIFLRTIIIPLFSGCAVIAFYLFVFNPWLIKFLE